MALRRTLSERLLSCRRAPPPTLAAASGSSAAPASDLGHSPLRREYFTSPEFREGGFLRRFLQRRSLNQATAGMPPEILSIPVGDRLRERLRGMSAPGHRLRLDGLSPPAPAASDPAYGLSVAEARTLLRLARIERLKSELRGISESSITYGEYLKICKQACENEDEGKELAKTMDESGNVIVLGNVVFLRPEQVN